MRKPTIQLRTFVLTLAVSCASAAEGQITALHIVSQRTPSDVLPGYVANDLLIDFDGVFTGSKMIVRLNEGSIYQNDELGGDRAPNPALFAVDATVEWDTFIANGGPTSADTIGNFGKGGAAIGIEPGDAGRNAQFDDEGIDQAWNPASGNEILDQENFMVARVTLSDDAVGEVLYLASANQVLGVPLAVAEGLVTGVFEGELRQDGAGERFVRVPIFNGVIGAVPEPSTFVLVGLGLTSLVVWKGRGRRTCPR